MIGTPRSGRPPHRGLPHDVMPGLVLPPLPSLPSFASETRTVAGVQLPVAPRQVSRRKTSDLPLVSPGTRLSAAESNTAVPPPGFTMKWSPVAAFAWVESLAKFTRAIVAGGPGSTGTDSCGEYCELQYWLLQGLFGD